MLSTFSLDKETEKEKEKTNKVGRTPNKNKSQKPEIINGNVLREQQLLQRRKQVIVIEDPMHLEEREKRNSAEQKEEKSTSIHCLMNPSDCAEIQFDFPVPFQRKASPDLISNNRAASPGSLSNIMNDSNDDKDEEMPFLRPQPSPTIPYLVEQQAPSLPSPSELIKKRKSHEIPRIAEPFPLDKRRSIDCHDMKPILRPQASEDDEGGGSSEAEAIDKEKEKWRFYASNAGYVFN